MNSFVGHSFYKFLILVVFVGNLFAQGYEWWQALRKRYLGLRSLSGSFVETIEPSEGSGQEPMVFKGSFVFQLPGSFRLEVIEPVKQVIVGNDSVVWFYFPNERRAVLQTRGQPVPLLAFLAPLMDSAVTVVDEGDVVIAVYSDGRSYLNELRLELDKKRERIKAFSFVDEWGNRCRFLLLNQQWNPVVSKKQFMFVPPKGTGVEYQ